MSAVSTAAASPHSPQSRLAAVMASRPMLVALLVTALVTALRLVDTVDSDVAWQLWIAARIHAGANLYTDIVEVNPPLWFWMALPVDRIATFLHVRPEPVLIVMLGGLVALSLAATNRLLGHAPASRRTPLLTYGALSLMAMPWMHVGQREQLVLIGTIPYAALVAARRQGKRVSPLLAVSIGAGAALGFALKQYFLLIPLLLETWLLAAAGKRWRPVRAETVAIVSVGVAYATALVLLEPDFLSRTVPLIRLAYGVFGAPSLRFMFGPLALVGFVMLALAATQHRQFAKAPFASALLVAACGFVLTYFIQSKGWPYHSIPMLGCVSLALVTLMAEADEFAGLFRIVAPALLACPLLLAADEEMHPALPSPDLLGAVAGLRSGDSVGFLTTESALPWSVTLQRGYRFPSRYMGYWMMRAIIRNEHLGNPDPRLAALGRQVVADTIDDFLCMPPKRIIVWRPRNGEDAFDILPFFERSPDFVALLSHYRVRSRTSLEAYDQVSALPPPRSQCRAGV